MIILYFIFFFINYFIVINFIFILKRLKILILIMKESTSKHNKEDEEIRILEDKIIKELKYEIEKKREKKKRIGKSDLNFVEETPKGEEEDIKKKKKGLEYTKEEIKIYEQNINKQKREYEAKIKEEKNNYEKQIQNLEKEQKHSLNLIEEIKIEKIKENNKKFQDLLKYIDSIKNDKQKLVEFFKNLDKI